MSGLLIRWEAKNENQRVASSDFSFASLADVAPPGANSFLYELTPNKRQK